MKMIVAIIRPESLETVHAALNQRDLYLMTVTDAGGCGRYRFFTEMYRGSEFQVRVQARVRLELVVEEANVETAIEAIVHGSRTGDAGEMGDGKIFVLPVEDCVRIRTGARGPEAVGQ